MVQATLSSKYQLVIPKAIREETGITPGEKIQIINKNGIINLIPSHLLKDLRGYLKGMDSKNFREEKER